MAIVSFTDNLRRHLDCPPRQVRAVTGMDALQQVLAENTRLAPCILDDQDWWKHVAIFSD